MHTETTISSCPLCRRPAQATGFPLHGTRLCEQCQSLLSPIKPRPSSASGPLPSSVPSNGSSTGDVLPQMDNALAGFADGSDFSEAELSNVVLGESVSDGFAIPITNAFTNEREGQSGANELLLPMEATERPLTTTGQPIETRHSIFTNGNEGDSDDGSYEGDSNNRFIPRPSGALDPQRMYRPELFKTNSIQTSGNTILAERAEETFATPQIHQFSEEKSEAKSEVKEVLVDHDLSELAAVASVRRNTGPLERTAPTTRAQTAPVAMDPPFADQVFLVPKTTHRKSKGFRKPIAAFVLLSSIAALGYLGYEWLFSSGKVASRQKSASTDDKSTRPPGASPAVVLPTPESETAASTSGSAPTSTAKQDDPQAAVPSSNGAADLDARYSLQAASFSNEADAKLFSEKLMRVGVPAYIVAAVLPKRGRWFRVRVGRFSTTEEANRYIVQSKQRAKTAGMTLDLIVCDYEKP